MSVFPVLIPSLGRAGRATTPHLLAAAEIPYVLQVEREEEEAYRRAYPGAHIIVLANSGAGYGYACYAALAYARSQGWGWYWFMDDDLKGFRETKLGRNHKVDVATALLGAQGYFQHREDVALGALEHQQYAWCAKQPFVTNGYANAAVAVHTGRTLGCQYRPTMRLKTDQDFTLQLLTSGWQTMRVTRYSFDTGGMGKAPGGCQADYARAWAEKEAAETLRRLWGDDLVTVVQKKDGRWDAKIRWAAFKGKP